MPPRKAQHPRAATPAVAISGAFPYRTHGRSPLILFPWHQYKEIPPNEIIHHRVSCLFSPAVCTQLYHRKDTSVGNEGNLYR